MRHHIALTWLLALTLPLSPGCGHDHEHGHHHHDHDHTHAARNGGSLVVLAEEFAHMEVLVDAEAGVVSAWALDAHCEHYEKLAQPTIDLTFAFEGEDREPFTLALAAQYGLGTSNEEGASSWFEATDERLVGLVSFDGTFGTITSRGQTFESTSFPYPEGNDARADHDHDHDH